MSDKDKRFEEHFKRTLKEVEEAYEITRKQNKPIVEHCKGHLRIKHGHAESTFPILQNVTLVRLVPLQTGEWILQVMYLNNGLYPFASTFDDPEDARELMEEIGKYIMGKN